MPHEETVRTSADRTGVSVTASPNRPGEHVLLFSGHHAGLAIEGEPQRIVDLLESALRQAHRAAPGVRGGFHAGPVVMDRPDPVEAAAALWQADGRGAASSDDVYAEGLIDLAAVLTQDPEGEDPKHAGRVRSRVLARPLVTIPHHENEHDAWCPFSGCTTRDPDGACPAGCTSVRPPF